jgi:hypothetical protein
MMSVPLIKPIFQPKPPSDVHVTQTFQAMFPLLSSHHRGCIIFHPGFSNPKSKEFEELFRSFLSSKDERTNILALSEEDARLFIEIIDRVRFSRTFLDACSMISTLDVKAFRAARLETELRQLAFSVLRKLCGRIGHLPESYLLSDEFDLSGTASRFWWLC